jgi:hypothetical protein
MYFRIAEQYRGEPIVAVELRNPDLLDRIERHRRRERDSLTDPVHRGLRRWVEEMEVLPDAPFDDVVLDRIRIGDHWFAVCDQGRVHTPATTLARHNRRLVRLAGHKLVSVDVSCSQPLLLAVTLEHKIQKRPHTTPRKAGRTTPRGAGRGPKGEIPFVPYPSYFGEKDEFLSDCLSGAVYDRFASVLGVTREAAKVELLAVVFGAPHRYNRAKAECFSSLYPFTWQRVLSITSALYVRGGELARRMQTVESDLMISGVARFLREYPDVPVLTCHDALLVPPNAASDARDLILDEWHRRYRLRPRVKITPWTGD